MKTTFALLGLFAVVMAVDEHKSTSNETPRELGRIKFERNFAKGMELAKSLGRPALVLFQEVPG